MKLILVVVLAAISALTYSALLDGSLQKDLFLNRGYLEVIYDTLAAECPDYIRSSRGLTEVSHEAHTEVQHKLYTQLLQKLIDCRTAKLAKKYYKSTTKQSTLSTIEQTTVTTTELTTSDVTKQTTSVTEKKTTPNVKQPVECQRAVNYSEAWRLDHTGGHIKPGGPHSSGGYACDLHKNSSQWFRFTGAAGNRMLDSCPPAFSCGTVFPMWTGDPMPNMVGVETEIRLDRVGHSGDCQHHQINHKVKVIRCSWDTPHDLIYKQTSNYPMDCTEAFCGMV